jgi:hypothetical protein
MRYTIYSAEGEPLKQCATAQLAADNAQPGNVTHDSDPANAYPYVVWHAGMLGMVGTPHATAAAAFAHVRGEA